jgi:uncharacterized protein YcgI (DUF1989 family)
MMRLRAAVLLPHLLQRRQTGVLLPNSQETRVVHSPAKSPFGAYFSRLYTGSIGRSATAAAVNSIRSVDIPACSGAWLPVSAGQFIRITDIEGQQVADMWAVCAADFSEFLSAAVTRGAGERLFPPVGGAFFSNRYRPLLTLLADKSPGVHDMLWPACDAHLYASFGITGDDVPSCSSNFRKAAAEFGWTPEQVGWQCVMQQQVQHRAWETQTARFVHSRAPKHSDAMSHWGGHI